MNEKNEEERKKERMERETNERVTTHQEKQDTISAFYYNCIGLLVPFFSPFFSCINLNDSSFKHIIYRSKDCENIY